MASPATRVGVVPGDGAVLRKGSTVVVLGASVADELVDEASSLLDVSARNERIRGLAGLFLRHTLAAAAVVDVFDGGADAFAVGAVEVVVAGERRSAADQIMGLSARYMGDELEAVLLSEVTAVSAPSWASLRDGAVVGGGVVIGEAAAARPDEAGDVADDVSPDPEADAPAAAEPDAPDDAPAPAVEAPSVAVLGAPADAPDEQASPPRAGEPASTDAEPAPPSEPAAASTPVGPPPAGTAIFSEPLLPPGAIAAPDASPAPPPPPAAAPPPPPAAAPPPPPPPPPAAPPAPVAAAAPPPPPPVAAAAPPPPPPVGAPPPPAPPPPPPSAAGSDGPPAAGGYEVVSLTAPVDLSDRLPVPEMPADAEPGPTAPEMPDDEMPPYAKPVQVLGVMSPRGFFNHPDARFCSRTGVKMGASETRVLVKGDRPPLGVLTFDDGSTHSMQWNTVVGRDPAIDDLVASGNAAPLTLTDDELKISRRHLLLELRDWDVLLSDLGTANGTYVRERPDQPPRRLAGGEKVVLSSGAEVYLGDRSFTYHEHHVR